MLSFCGWGGKRWETTTILSYNGRAGAAESPFHKTRGQGWLLELKPPLSLSLLVRINCLDYSGHLIRLSVPCDQRFLIKTESQKSRNIKNTYIMRTFSIPSLVFPQYSRTRESTVMNTCETRRTLGSPVWERRMAAHAKGQHVSDWQPVQLANLNAGDLHHNPPSLTWLAIQSFWINKSLKSLMKPHWGTISGWSDGCHRKVYKQ